GSELHDWRDTIRFAGSNPDLPKDPAYRIKGRPPTRYKNVIQSQVLMSSDADHERMR
ncbi:hypothetical protein NPIL_234461, partial [Nephila pilipes]